MSSSDTRGDFESVRGWLLFFCVSLTILNPLAWGGGLVSFINMDLAGESFDALRAARIVDTTYGFGVVTFGFLAGIALWRREAGAVHVARVFLVAQLAYAAISPVMYVAIGTEGQQFVVAGIRGAVGALGYGLIWYLYLGMSKRVRSTFPTTDKATPRGSLLNLVARNPRVGLRVALGVAIAGIVTSYSHHLVFAVEMSLSDGTTGHASVGDGIIALSVGRSVLEGLLFGLLAVVVRSDRLLPIIWSAVFVALVIITRSVLGNGFPTWIGLVSLVAVGFFLMAAVTVSLKLWGLRFWALTGGITAGQLAAQLLLISLYLAMGESWEIIVEFLWGWDFIVDGLIYGLAIYIALYPPTRRAGPGTDLSHALA